MKCLVYGIYFLEFVQSILIAESTFRIFATNFRDVGFFDRIETAWLSVPIITAFGTFSCTWLQGWSSNIPPSYIRRPNILRPPDQHFGRIEETRGSNCCCESSKYSGQIQYLNSGKLFDHTALLHSIWRWDCCRGFRKGEETLQLAFRTRHAA